MCLEIPRIADTCPSRECSSRQIGSVFASLISATIVLRYIVRSELHTLFDIKLCAQLLAKQKARGNRISMYVDDNKTRGVRGYIENKGVEMSRVAAFEFR